jgi:SAM-dependent methyltransferase
VVDVFVRPFFRLFTRQPIPPLRLMVRVGVGNNIIFPHYQYLTLSVAVWLYFFRKGFATLDSRIVEIGSGVGRSVVALRDFSDEGGEKFHGSYHGFDIDPEMVRWCQEHFPADNFRFTLLDMHSTIYNPRGSLGNRPHLDVADNSVDLVYSFSLFTHLLEEEVRHYISESFRILRPCGVMSMTFFCLDDLEQMQLLGGRWTFSHRIGSAYVQDKAFPESAVAYRKAWILELARSFGFSHLRVVPGAQSVLQGSK